MAVRAGPGTRRVVRIPHPHAGDGAAKRIRHAALPAAEGGRAQTADLFRDLGPHPMDAAEISNSTGKTLDGGPITVYDAGAYAGEALMETVQGRRQTADQLCRGPGHPHHHQI